MKALEHCCAHFVETGVMLEHFRMNYINREKNWAHNFCLTVSNFFSAGFNFCILHSSATDSKTSMQNFPAVLRIKKLVKKYTSIRNWFRSKSYEASHLFR